MESRSHPAWRMLIACCFLVAGGLGTIFNSAGIMIPAVMGDLKFQQGPFMLYMTLQGLAMAVALPIAGRLLPRVNIRVLVSAGIVVAAAAYASMGLFSHLWQWYIAGPILGLAAFAFMLPAPVIIANWFKKKTGFAMGIAMMCSGIAGAIINPLGKFFIDQFGWRTTYALLGLISCALVLPFSLFVIRFKPADIGVQAYGAEEASATASGAPVALPGVSQSVALKSVAFVCLFLVAGILSLNSSFMQLLPTFAVSAGMVAISALMASAAMIGNIVGKIVLGWLNDKVGARNATFVGLAVGLASFLLLIVSGAGNTTLAIVGAMLFGAMTALVQVSLPLIVRTAFGLRDYSAIYSYVTMGTTIIGAAALPIVGWSFDATGSYQLALIAMIATSVVAGLLLTLGLNSAKSLQREEVGAAS